jgi:hypothetical protein
MNDRPSSAPKYETHIEHAEHVAIGDGSQVPSDPDPSLPSYKELSSFFHEASATLRHASGEIAGVHIERSEVEAIVRWIQEAAPEKRLGMLQDQPGSGKTVVMRDVLAQLEGADVPVLAIKADVLSGVETQDDLADRLGIPASVVDCVRTLASEGPLVVLLDQLDALSMTLSRDQVALDVMLTTLARLRDIENVRIVASCRVFELHNDPRLSAIKVDHTFKLHPLDEAQVNRVLKAIGIDPDSLLPEHRDLITVPLHLKIYAQIIGQSPPQGSPERFQTLQELYEALWRRRIMAKPPPEPPLGVRREALYRLVDEMQARRQLTVPVAVLDAHMEACKYLQREGYIRREGGNWLFAHQTLFDYCYARRFVAQGKTLSAEIISGSQGLFERSQMIQVLVYLRGADEVTYLRELDKLLTSQELRTHLRLLLIGWLGSLPNPTPDELRIARRLIADPDGRPRFFRAVSGNQGWFTLLNADVVPLLLRSSDERRIDLAVGYLGTMIEVCPDAVLADLRPYFDRNETWNARIGSCLSHLDTWESEEAVAMLCDLLRDGQSGVGLRHTLWKLAHSNPAAGCRALRAHLDRRLDVLLAEEAEEALKPSIEAVASSQDSVSDRLNWDRELLGEYAVDEIMEAAAAKCPESLIEYLLPWFLRILNLLVGSDERKSHYSHDPLFSYSWYSDHLMEGAKFTFRLATALKHVAQTDTDHFRDLANLLATSETFAAQRILAHAYLSAPSIYAEDIFHYLIEDPRRLSIGERADWESCQLYRAAFRYGSAERRNVLERMILDLQPDWELRALKLRGITQLRFLQTVPRDLLSDEALDLLGQLKRKFPEHKSHPPQGITGGFIGPPIDSEAQKRMSDDAWLSAMRKYNDSGYEHRDFLKGGARQLASSFSEHVKAEPERFYQLTHRFDDRISLFYIDAAISGLVASEAPAEWVFDVIRRFASRVNDSFRRRICWSLQERAETGVPDDILNLLTDWALNDPDPKSKIWPRLTSGENPNHLQGPYQHGINSNRGAALQVVCQCAMKRSPPQIDRVWELLGSSAEDPATAVRACVVRCLRWVVREDADRAIGVFWRALDGHPRLLQSPIAHQFLYWTHREHFQRVRPFIEAVLVDPADVARQAGARLACLSAFRHAETEALVNRVMEGDALLRQGAAQVYARNLENEKVEEVCREQLLKLMMDSDANVRSEVGRCFVHLRAEHLVRLEPFIRQYLDSPALMDGAEHLVEYLAPLTADALDLALDVTERILDVMGDEVEDVQRAAFVVERDLVRLPLTVYTHTQDPNQKSRAMDLFERLLLRGSRSAQKALEEWDRR